MYTSDWVIILKKNASEFLPEFISSNDIFKSLCQNHPLLSTRQLHEKWLDKIRDKVQVRASYEDEIPPSFTALHFHWLRSCLVSQMYEQASDNTIALPTYSEYGYEVRNCDTTVVPIWDDKHHIEAVENHVKWLLRGCKCKKGCMKNNCKCKKNNQKCGPGCSCINYQNCSESVGICSEIEIEESVGLASSGSDSEDEQVTIQNDNL
ncbi:unnamed protein product [Mytilus edulis]|uniref:Tesmin/TSO1-like CXC domain-containing protein n=1 Tax=Mytilus edulis TaxID=6550 RepID=A0A8S3T043_MYTED|nr:unnamed protein product [Mytilus edulis]